ncbi:MAG: polysaccharide deacetylase family protein [Firmicutes bacterium]|nr:polysaccharide deacetylase family protein [Bacillota bacterium]
MKTLSIKKILLIALVLLLLFAAAFYYWLTRSLDGTPVLAYHAVEDVPFTESEHLFVTPAEFEDQIKWLKRAGYEFAFADDPGAFKKSRRVIITFDDGYKDNLTEALPILEKYGAKATVFVATKNLGMNEYFLTEEELKTLSESPCIRIGSHTDGHYLLTGLSDVDKEKQLSLSKKRLEEITGGPVDAFSYPGGYSDEASKTLALKYYSFCYTYPGANWIVTSGRDRGDLPRITVERGTSGLRLLLMLKRSLPVS